MATRKPSNPDAVAIHAVAKAANLSSRELMDAIEQWDLGWDATNHMKRLSPEQIQEVERRLDVKLLDTLKKEAAKKAAAKSKGKKKTTAAKEKKTSAKDAKPAAKKSDKSDKKQDDSSKAKGKKKDDERPQKKTQDDAAAKQAEQKKSNAKDERSSDDASKDADQRKKKKNEKTPKDDRKGAKDDADAASKDTPKDDGPTPEETAARAKEIVADVLDGMGFPHPRIRVDVSKDAVRISLAGRGTAEILGQRNASARTDVLEALQLVVQKSLFGNDHRHGPAVAIDVMGFRAGREEELRAMAQRMAEYVQKTGKVLRISAMNFIDRRAVHQGIDAKDVRTESTGYGALRALEISKDDRSKRGKNDRRQDRGKDAKKNDRKGDDASAQEDDRNASKSSRGSDKKKSNRRDDDAKPSRDTKKSRAKDDAPKDKSSSKKSKDNNKNSDD